MVPPPSRFQTILLFAFFASLTSAAKKNSQNKAQRARWLVQSSLWGTLSYMKQDPSSSPLSSSSSSPSSRITSMAQSNGRIFYYLPSFHNETNGFSMEGSLTLSEAALNSTQFEGARCGVDGALDPEDPRCAKLTLSGTIQPCHNDDLILGKNALFHAHPQMANWPPNHNFMVYEHHLTQLWMIDGFGGGIFIQPDEYYHADDPSLSLDDSIRNQHRIGTTETTTNHNNNNETNLRQRPEFTHDPIGHARWLVYQSLWTTVTTRSSRHAHHTFGNIRSIVDGTCLCSSSGKPSFYLPNPDPTTKDILQNKDIVLSFTEAVLSDLVDEENGVVCDGKDPEDPTCAKLSLIGRAVELTEKEVRDAQAGFKARHPRAKWLSDGSAHTGGGYYTIEIRSMEFFRSYGGMTEVDVKEYESWVVPGMCGSFMDTTTVEYGGHEGVTHHHHKTSSKNNSRLELSTVDKVFGLLLCGILIVLVINRKRCGK